MPISGLHHVTAIASDPQQNLNFYTQVLGLRLVKVTVNFDAPEVYHLYYGDATAQPGSILTFFPFVGAAKVRHGVGQTYATAFAVPTTSLDFWRGHLDQYGISTAESTRFGEQVVSFADPDGTQLELIAHAPANAIQSDIWDNGLIPTEHAVRGFHGVTLWEAAQEPTAILLTDAFGYTKVAEDGLRVRYAAQSEDLARYVDIVTKTGTQMATGGAGSVHHIAFRTPTDADQLAWQTTLMSKSLRVTPVQDRQYFHSIYFREPGGVLFEIATDTPGFFVDESDADLGQALKLPEWLEVHRPSIEANLLPITRPTIIKE